MSAFSARPHQWGPGKVHEVSEADPARTLCGLYLANVDGDPSTDPVTCGGCQRKAQANAQRATDQLQQWGDRKAQERAAAQAELEAYQRTDEWRAKAKLVCDRAGWICEACGQARAKRIFRKVVGRVPGLGREPLFDLAAVCEACLVELTK